MYGQFCMIHKETDTVLAMTAVTGDMQGEMNVYYEEVLLHYPNQPLADFLDLMDLCQYFEHKKLKGYADFFNSSSSFCCGVI